MYNNPWNVQKQKGEGAYGETILCLFKGVNLCHVQGKQNIVSCLSSKKMKTKYFKGEMK